VPAATESFLNDYNDAVMSQSTDLLPDSQLTKVTVQHRDHGDFVWESVHRGEVPVIRKMPPQNAHCDTRLSSQDDQSPYGCSQMVIDDSPELPVSSPSAAPLGSAAGVVGASPGGGGGTRNIVDGQAPPPPPPLPPPTGRRRLAVLLG
jgi:hypothetical protein